MPYHPAGGRQRLVASGSTDALHSVLDESDAFETRFDCKRQLSIHHAYSLLHRASGATPFITVRSIARHPRHAWDVEIKAMWSILRGMPSVGVGGPQRCSMSRKPCSANICRCCRDVPLQLQPPIHSIVMWSVECIYVVRRCGAEME